VISCTLTGVLLKTTVTSGFCVLLTGTCHPGPDGRMLETTLVPLVGEEIILSSITVGLCIPSVSVHKAVANSIQLIKRHYE